MIAIYFPQREKNRSISKTGKFERKTTVIIGELKCFVMRIAALAPAPD